MTTTSPRFGEAVIEPLRHIAIIGPNAIVLNRNMIGDPPAWCASHPETGLPEASNGGVANDIPRWKELLPHGQRSLTAGKTTCYERYASLAGAWRRTEARRDLSSW
jgi:hypothetical protein